MDTGATQGWGLQKHKSWIRLTHHLGNKNVPIQISPKSVPKGPIDNK